MGTWGAGIKQDDVVCDVIDFFEEQLKNGATIPSASRSTFDQFSDSLDDEDEGPLVWIGLAEAQWCYGDLNRLVLDHVMADFEQGNGLTRWHKSSTSEYQKRRQVLDRFISKISVPKINPKKWPKRISRPPPFVAGDCLAIKLSNGLYGAALVLRSDHSNIEYGKNLVGILDYMAADPPNLIIFKKRRWLKLSHHDWKGVKDIAWYLPFGLRKTKKLIEIVGHLKINWTDPKDSNSYNGWHMLGEQIVLQKSWEAGAH